MPPKEVILIKESINNYFQTIKITDIVFTENGVTSGDIDITKVYDFTGVIGISGKYKGGLFVTCERALLAKIMKVVMNEDLDENSIQEAMLADLIGEMANTMSGYFQGVYGNEFSISIPHVVIGQANLSPIHVTIRKPSYWVSFSWKNCKGLFAFSIEAR